MGRPGAARRAIRWQLIVRLAALNFLLLLFFAVLSAPRSVGAVVEGVTPQKVADFKLFGSHSATGAAIMVPGPVSKEISSILLSQASQSIVDMPFDHKVEAAYLFWSGSAPRTNRIGPPDGPDFDVDFSTADGSFYNDLSVFSDPTGFGGCSTTDDFGGFYYCRRDVTDLVAAQGLGNANGTYTVGDLESDPGTLDPADPQRAFAQGKFAGWSLIIVWSSASETVLRDVVLYDGFVRLDENAFSAGQVQFPIGDFTVGSPPLGKLTVFGMEGDSQLGVPPQDSTGCDTCFDFIAFQSGSGGASTKLSNGSNPENNSFNSSWGGQAGIDIDTYDLFGLLNTGDVSGSVTLSSGDGIVPGGDGESFFVGWTIMSIDTLTPKFLSTSTRKSVSPTSASAGQTLFYTLDLSNEGSLDASNVVLQDAVPAGAFYVENSTRVDGTPVPDVSGTSALVGGLSLGVVPTSANGDSTRQVTFQVRVDDSACGATVENSATLTADGIDPVVLGPAVSSINDASLETPLLTVATLGSDPIGPGSFLRYTLEVQNGSEAELGGISVETTLPTDLLVDAADVSTDGGGTVSISGQTVRVEDITVDPGTSTLIRMLVRVRSVTEFAAIGIAESQIDGRVVTTQGLASGGCGVPKLTDDPSVPGAVDATATVLTYRPVLATSSKSAVDSNGGALEPGDEIAFAIRVQNSGNRTAQVRIADPLPAGTSYVAGSTSVDGVSRSDVGGEFPFAVEAGLGNVGPGSFSEVTFRARVDAETSNGVVIENVAALVAVGFADENVEVRSPILTVFATPDLSASRKTVRNVTSPGSDFEPGHEVEYEIALDNAGNRPATNLVVLDPVPEQLTFVSASGGGSFDGSTVRWPLSDLAPEASVSVTFRAVIDSPLPDGFVIANVATVESDELEDLLLERNLTVDATPILTVTKVGEFSSTPVRPGDAVVYRLRIENSGSGAAFSVELDDALPPELRNTLAPGASVSGATVQFNESTDPRFAVIEPGPGNAVEVSISAEVRSPLANGTVVTNQATVRAEGLAPVLSDDPTLPGLTDATSFSVESDLRLTFVKTVTDLSPSTPFSPGDSIRYDFRVDVSGDGVLSGASIVDVLPPQLERGGQLVAFDLGELSPGDSITRQLVDSVRSDVADGTVVSNQAEFSAVGVASLSSSDGSGVDGAPTTFEVVARPILALSKSVALESDPGGDSEFNPGDSVRYVLTLRNTGNTAANDIVLADTQPEDLAFIDVGDGSFDGSTVRFSGGPEFSTLAPGGEIVRTLVGRIAIPLDDGTVISNVASAASANAASIVSDDPALPGAADPTEFLVRSAPVLTEFFKTVSDESGDPLQALPGDTVRYLLSIRNTGDAIARDLVIRDPIPTGLTLVDLGGGASDGTLLTFDWGADPRLAALDPGDEVQVHFAATINADVDAGTRIANQATALLAGVAVSSSDDPGTSLLGDSTDIFVSGDVDLGGSSMTVSDVAGVPVASASPGDRLRYTIALSNRGTGAANNVEVAIALPAELTAASASEATVTGNSIVFSESTMAALASLSPGDTIVLTFEAELAAGTANDTIVSVQGRISASELADAVATDADPSTLVKETTDIVVVASTTLSATKIFVEPVSATPLAEARPGDPVRILIEVSNTGTGAAQDVVVSDAIDTEKLTNVLVRDGGTFGSGTARWDSLVVPAGGSVALRIDARLRAPLDNEALVNQATISGPGGTLVSDDPSVPGDADPTVLKVLSSPSLAASKSVPGIPDRNVAPGQSFSYSIELTNSGMGSARDLSVHDVLPEGLTFVSASDLGTFESASREVRWSLPTLGPGAVETLTLNVVVGADQVDGTQILNQALIKASNTSEFLSSDPLAAGEGEPTGVSVVSGPLFSNFSMTVAPVESNSAGFLFPGDEVEYALRMENVGNAAATSVVIRDALSPLLTDPAIVDGQAFRIEGSELVFDETTVPELASVASGATVSLRFRLTLAEAASGTEIANQATLVAAELDDVELSDDPGTAESDDPTRISFRYPVLSFTKSVDQSSPVAPGASLDYDLVVENVGLETVNGIRVRDALPEELSVVDVGSGEIVDGEVRWSRFQVPSFAVLAPGERVSLALSTVVAADTADGTVVSNQAVLTANGMGELLSDWLAVPGDVDPTVTKVAIPPVLDVRKRPVGVEGGIVAPNQVYGYVIEVENTGTVAATELRILDSVDSSLVVTDIGTATVDGADLEWRIDAVAPGELVTLPFEVRVTDGASSGTTIANQANVAVAGLAEEILSDDPSTATPNDPTLVEVVAEPSLAASVLIARDSNGGTVQPGDRIDFELRVINDGTRSTTSTTATTALPAYTSYVNSSTTVNGLAVPDVDGSPLNGGVVVTSRRDGTPAGVVVPNDEVEPFDEVSVVRFSVRVDPRAAPGTRIETQALLRGEGMDAQRSDDCTRVVAAGLDDCSLDSLVGEPTVLVVGGGGALVLDKRAELLVDSDGDGQPDVGEQLRYRMRVSNVGTEAAIGAVFVDSHPTGALFEPGGLTLAGEPSDEASLSDAGWSVPIGALAPGDSLEITTIAKIVQGPVVVSQASVLLDGREVLSDGEPNVTGSQPTRTVIAQDVAAVAVYLEVEDQSGGVVEAGDSLRYRVVVQNDGPVDLVDTQLNIEATDAFQGLSFDLVTPSGATVLDPSAPSWVLSIEAGETREFEAVGRLSERLNDGDAVRAVASILGPEVRSAPVEVVVGAGVGSATLRGSVFREVGERNGQFDAERDLPLEGMTIAVVPASADGDSSVRSDDPAGDAVRVVRSRTEGNYDVQGLAPGTYRIYVLSESGATFASSAQLRVSSGLTEVPPIAVDPSGIIYEVRDNAPVPIPGARVYLVDEATGEDVVPNLLAGGQQGQSTTSQGLYRFDLQGGALPGDFRLRIEPPAGTLVFPSSSRPPIGSTDAEPFGVAADPGPVVDREFPDLEDGSRYFLRFSIDANTEDIVNNHVPLDRLEQSIRLTKAVNRKSASIGDILTYTVTVTNPLSIAVGSDGVGDGAFLVDALPAGIQWANRDAVVTVNAGGAVSRAKPLPVERRDARTVRFAAMTLPPRSTTTIRYYGVVGLRARGEQVNRAWLANQGNVRLSNVGEAVLQVVDDPVFDQGTLLGRVWCDDDGDGEKGPNEMGLPGARVYLDTGFFVDTDFNGKYHFRGIKPGRHLVKVDPNSLPGTSMVTTDSVRDFLLTRGLLAKMDFGVRCEWERVLASAVAQVASTSTATVVLDSSVPAISIDRRAQAVPLVDAVLAAKDSEADFSRGGIAIDPGRDFLWHLQAEGAVDISAWSIALFSDDEKARELWRIEGQGPPPVRIPFEIEGDTLSTESGTSYLYRLHVESSGGDVGEGRWRRLLFTDPVDEQDGEAQELAVIRGELFDQNDAPSALLKEKLAALVAEHGSDAVIVEVHSAGEQSRSANLFATQRRAVAALDELVALGVARDGSKALGRGDNEPIMPNMTSFGRKQNARVVVKAIPKPASAPGRGEVSGPSYEAHYLVNGTPFDADGHRVEATVQVSDGELLTLDVREADGRRLKIRRTWPLGSTEEGSDTKAEVRVGGTLGEDLTVGGKAVEDPLLGARCTVNDAKRVGEELDQPLSFALSTGAVKEWRLRVFNADGSVLVDREGKPGEAIEWNGINEAGHFVARASRYTYRCFATDNNGSQLATEPYELQLSASEGGESEREALEKVVLSGDSYPQNPSEETRWKDWAEKLAAAPEMTAKVEVHDNADGGRLQAQLRTARTVAAIKAALVAGGATEGQLELVALGANKPLMPGSSTTAMRMNRRVEVALSRPTVSQAPQGDGAEASAGTLSVAGREVAVGESGVFDTVVVSEPDAPLVADMTMPSGRHVVLRVPLFQGRPKPARLPTGRSIEAGDVLRGSRPQDLAAAGPREPENSSATPNPRAQVRAAPPEGAKAFVEAPSMAVSHGKEAPLEVWLPANGTELQGERLTVMGRADRTLTVRINGEVTALDSEGYFSHTVVLSSGEQTVTVSGEGEAGVVEVSRSYTVPSGEWFLMAFADTAVGKGDGLAGMNSESRAEFENEIYVHGRAVAYFKGRIQGKSLLESSPFEQYRVTAHVDTGKQDEDDLLRQLIDPDRYYPVYGDAAEEVQDVSSRSKLFVLLQADDSELRIGNFRAELQGIELFQYQRSHFGVNLDVDHEFVDGQRTEVKAFAADGESGLRHRQSIFQGTGGSLYFLRDDNVLEGSERVQIVIRDEVSGNRLMAIPQVRNQDYSIEYRDGRVMFMQPIPSTVGTGWHLNQNPPRTLQGQRVFVEIEYDYEAGFEDDEEDAFAFHARQTIDERYSVGAGIVDESRDGSHYQLVGAEGRAKLLERMEVTAEFAVSRATDASTLASFDGGVTFGRIGMPSLSGTGLGGGELNGWAGKLAVRGDASEFLSPLVEDAMMPFDAYVQHQDAGFYSGTSIMEQGQTKFGGQFVTPVSDKDSVRVRHDGVWTTSYDVLDTRRINRQISSLGYDHKGDGWTAGAEVGQLYSKVEEQGAVYRSTFNVFGTKQLTPRLQLLGEQELFHEWGGPTTVASEVRADSNLDKFATTIGAEYMLSDRLALNASETLRWSGFNSAQVGLRAKVMEDVDVYSSERLVAGTSGTVSTLIVGAESRTIPGSRSYAEYQLDHLSSGRNGRAVFGTDNAWNVADGLKLSLSYERAQLLGGAITSSYGPGYSVQTPGFAGNGSGATARDQQFTASSYAGSGVFPSGVASRDAFSVGGEYLPNPLFKLGGRLELRYDRGDESYLVPDRLTLFGHLGGDYRVHSDLVLLARARGASVRRTDVGFDEAQFLDLTLGLALRPRHTDRYGALFKWTRRYERRTVDAALTRFQLQIADVVALEPYFELPYGFQLVGKGALKLQSVSDAELASLRSTVILGIGRINYHLTNRFDAGVEYRWLGNVLTEEAEHGALVEVAWLPKKYVAVGVGYNFTRFTDDLLVEPDPNNHGVFLRITGRY